MGVGQSETAFSGMTDMYCLLQLPNAGDDLQAIKKGVMELADLIVINKADIDAVAATRAQAQITSSLRLYGFHGHDPHEGKTWHPRVMQLSALKAQGLDGFWNAVSEYRELETANGRLAHKRQQQSQAWMWERIHAGLRQQFSQAPAVRAVLADITKQVLQGSLAPSTAARQLLTRFSGDTSHA